MIHPVLSEDRAISEIDLYKGLSSTRRLLIIMTIMAVAVLEVLDSTIVNVSLPYMMPTLGADTEQITWVLTAYIVASAVMLPLTGFLSQRIGHKRLLLINMLGFGVASLASGLAQTLTQMVVFRLFQGAFGAALIPLSQSILRQSFPLEKQGKAMAIWGIGIMTAPIFGPTLGGFITSHLDWRWVFFVNLPVIAGAIALTLWVIPSSKIRLQKIDWLGIPMMFIGVGALQIMLDRGNQQNWFQSNSILLLLVISLFFITLFLLRSYYHRYPVIKLLLYKDRNFALCSSLFALFSGCTFGLITLEPLMFEHLFGYTAEIAGITMAPLGIASAVGMMIGAPLMTRINVKYNLIASLVLTSLGCLYFSHLNLQTAQINFVYANLMVGLGIGLFMVPIATYALATIPTANITEASGLFSYARMLGTSIGISLLGTLISRETQINWNRLGGHLTPFSQPLHTWLQTQHLSIHNKIAAALLTKNLLSQASMVAFTDAFHLLALVYLAMMLLVLFVKQIDLNRNNVSTH